MSNPAGLHTSTPTRPTRIPGWAPLGTPFLARVGGICRSLGVPFLGLLVARRSLSRCRSVGLHDGISGCHQTVLQRTGCAREQVVSGGRSSHRIMLAEKMLQGVLYRSRPDTRWERRGGVYRPSTASAPGCSELAAVPRNVVCGGSYMPLGRISYPAIVFNSQKRVEL